MINKEDIVYNKYLQEHKDNIGNKFPPMPKGYFPKTNSQAINDKDSEYNQYLQEHENNIGNKFPPMPKGYYETILKNNDVFGFDFNRKSHYEKTFEDYNR